MHLVLTLVGILATVIAVAGICSRLDLPSPLVLIAVGVVGSYLPFVPDVALEPEVVLFGLLPPLLYAAAIQTSLVDFNANRRPILLLSVGLVAFTTAGVAVLVHALLPDLGWAASFAIGAVVAPPDAVATTSIGRRIGLPRRIVTILEGESLLNDATALVALRTAIAATVAWQVLARDFLIAAGGGVLVGLAFFVGIGFVRKHVTDPVIDSGLSFLTPFAAYVAAEQIHASGVISVVVAGLLLGHKSPILQTAQSRIAERMNWRTVAFALESAVFLLIGLQARTIIGDAIGGEVTAARIALVCGGDPRRRDRAADRVGVLRALPAGPPRARRERPGAAVDLHVPHRLGRDARCRHARGGVRHPRGHAAPRRTPADRVHRDGRNPVHPGPLAAVARPATAGALTRTRRPTRSPGPTCCTRPRRPGWPSSRSSRRTTRTASAS